MQCITQNRLLEYRPDTLMSVRKEYNMEKPGMLEDAIRILREWIEKQQHFRKKDFPDEYLERTILLCKGSIERAKTQLDRMCTFRTLLPHFFGSFQDMDVGTMFEVAYPVTLPKLTPEHYRVLFFKINQNLHLIKDYLGLYNIILIAGEYLMKYDYCRGFYIILDYTETNIPDLLAKLNLMQFKQFLLMCIEGYGLRIKGVHIFTTSKLIDTVVTMVKPIFSKKVGSRIHVHRSLETLPDIVPLDILPKEYGGKERPLKELLNDFVEVISSKEYMDYLNEIKQATIDESFRLPDDFNENFAGMPGTFKKLNID